MIVIVVVGASATFAQSQPSATHGYMLNMLYIYTINHGFKSILFSALLAGIVRILDHRQRPKPSKLQKEIAALQSNLGTHSETYKDIIYRVLFQIFVGLSLKDTDRVTLYKHNGKAFILLGRYSSNPSFQSNGRPIYADSEGCIGIAWRNNESIITELPDPHLEAHDYLKFQLGYYLQRETIQNLNMKSRSYAAFRIQEPEGLNPLAVVVFESIRINCLDIEEIRRKIREDSEGKMIGHLLYAMRGLNWDPDPSFARERGF